MAYPNQDELGAGMLRPCEGRVLGMDTSSQSLASGNVGNSVVPCLIDW